MSLVALLIGGALGTLARYGVSLFATGMLAGTRFASFPLGTVLVNVTGSFLLSFLAAGGAGPRLSPTLQLALGTGFLGAFTTFSTFELENDLLLRNGDHAWALLYLLGNLGFGYAAVVLGRSLAASLLGRG